APLLRASILQIGERESVFLLTLHHIVFDGWSEGLLFHELSTLYLAYVSNAPSPLPDLTIQYPDYAVWQKQWLQAELQETLLKYWLPQLNNTPIELEIPTQYPRRKQQTRRSCARAFALPQPLSQSLTALSRQEGKTLFVVLLTAFKVLLTQYTGQPDVRVCTAVANRNRKELKNLIGYFVNLLILRSQLPAELNFQEALNQVHRVVTGAYAHQDLPIQLLAKQPDLEQTSFSQVLFILQNAPSQPLQLPGVSVERLGIDGQTAADFDLFFSMSETSSGLSGTLTYNRELFSEETVSQLLDHYQMVLERVVLDSKQSLFDLVPLSEVELKQLLNNRIHPQNDLNLTPEIIYTEGPRNATELKLIALWEKVLGVSAIKSTDDFFELGGGSLRALNLFALIEQTFNQKLPLATLLQAPTIEKLARVLNQNGAVEWSALVPIQPNGSEPPLFCVHGKGANILIFKALSSYLGPEQPLFGLQQVSALDGRQATADRIEDMATHYIREIRTVQPHGPYRLVGFSIGGVIAFEMAQQLKAEGEKITFVGLLDTFGPNCFKPLTLREKLIRRTRVLTRLGPKYPIKLAIKHAETSYYQIACRLYRLARRPLPYRLQKSTFGNALIGAERQYQPQPFYGPLTLFRASDAPGDVWYYRPGGMPTPDDWHSKDPQHGWGPLSTEEVKIIDVPGHHSGMLKEPHVKVLAKKVEQSLAQV
ncbi:MAG: condensation domain-containing protein, partial [Cyanobacteria bacterium P01_A01_bin.17]